ncbi:MULTISPECIES: ATP-dependent Clp protease adaptor ClpS [Tenacibaculum]|uniref:ATP-dependent Clp protease adaptor ClpS n=1 Tax=Tenacibaculum TaxID=104267 RepID=UPI001F0B3094|nr:MULTISPECIES: ATP-dependent Clp protease adaptor ClpS [Tenacibaculum]MCH3882819.1 ATP-dependent Clp protease adaptor ClpS [Tenacibaculum aquimarinum]MDO6600471.1 ATP-dependent Clp protease adaptor ClpS [Tenacibaculum sp. 1_MG-2023]
MKKINIHIKITKSSAKEETQEEVDVLEKEVNQHQIVLHNDDVNTFDHVIDSLMDVCEHTLVQAEQCATLVHYKGKCTVKTGEFKDLEPRCSKLLQLGLSAELV